MKLGTSLTRKQKKKPGVSLQVLGVLPEKGKDKHKTIIHSNLNNVNRFVILMGSWKLEWKAV